MNEAEQDVLSADVVVVEHPGLFLSQDNNPPRSVGKPLEHVVAPHSAVGEATELPRPFRMLARVPGGAMARGTPHYPKRSPAGGRSSHLTWAEEAVFPATPGAKANLGGYASSERAGSSLNGPARA